MNVFFNWSKGATSIEANAISEGFLCSMEMHGLWTEVQ